MKTTQHNHRSDCNNQITTTELRHQSSIELNHLDNEVRTLQQGRGSYLTLAAHSDVTWDGNEYSVEQTQEIVRFRTTFREYDIDSSRQDRRKLFKRLWGLQTGRRQTWEDDNRRKTTVRREATFKHCDAILQSCEVPERIRRAALRKTVSNELRGFSRYYSGADGACVGFALMFMFDNKEEAESSWVADRAADSVPEFDEGTVKKLIDYVFENYDGD